jgi:G3E family GTPase
VTVPVIVITGFLGAGKTTLVNRLLARRAARGATGKIGLVVNELGEVGIDGDLLAGRSARQIELPGGCVCCALGDELDQTLLDLIATTPGLEAIVLETTGVAEPLPIAWALEREPVNRAVRLAAVVTLIDATNFVASRPVSASVDSQVAGADVLLVTKAALVREDFATQRAETAARELAPRALIRRGSTDEHAAWLEALLADPALPEPASANAAAHVHVHAQASPEGQVGRDHVHDADCRHLDSHAAHGIDSVWLAVDEPLDVEELGDQLAELPANYVRIKGIVRSEGATWMAIHRVGLRISSEPIAPPEHLRARIVALGPGVTTSDLARCVVEAARVRRENADMQRHPAC